jgi:hypothetical protein
VAHTNRERWSLLLLLLVCGQQRTWAAPVPPYRNYTPIPRVCVCELNIIVICSNDSKDLCIHSRLPLLRVKWARTSIRQFRRAVSRNTVITRCGVNPLFPLKLANRSFQPTIFYLATVQPLQTQLLISLELGSTFRLKIEADIPYIPGQVRRQQIFNPRFISE